jgi:hypothetical protein
MESLSHIGDTGNFLKSPGSAASSAAAEVRITFRRADYAGSAIYQRRSPIRMPKAVKLDCVSAKLIANLAYRAASGRQRRRSKARKWLLSKIAAAAADIKNRLRLARAGSHPGRRQGPLFGVDLPPDRRPQSAARDPLRSRREKVLCSAAVIELVEGPRKAQPV